MGGAFRELDLFAKKVGWRDGLSARRPVLYNKPGRCEGTRGKVVRYRFGNPREHRRRTYLLLMPLTFDELAG